MGQDKREGSAGTFKKPRDAKSVLDGADWGTVDAKKLVKLIEIASKKGGAIRLGYTRDGGAYAIGVYAGQDYFTDYIRPSEDIDLYLEELAESWEGFDGQTTQTAVKKRAGKS